METNSYTYAVVTAQQLHLSKNFVVLDIIAVGFAASGAALISISLLKKERLEDKCQDGRPRKEYTVRIFGSVPSQLNFLNRDVYLFSQKNLCECDASPTQRKLTFPGLNSSEPGIAKEVYENLIRRMCTP
ncbi:MAG: hypothetical protein QW644_00960 [Candidatus Micrarchaeaceae archaeon]